jgi:hypothetical protein
MFMKSFPRMAVGPIIVLHFAFFLAQMEGNPEL